MDPGSIGAILASLKTVADVLKDWRKDGENVTVTMDAVSALTSAVLEAQEHTVEARQAQYELIRRNDELERELRDHKDRAAEKEKYEIVNVGALGTYVYALKRDAVSEDAPHWLCQSCFDTSRKVLLQCHGSVQSPETGMRTIWYCPACKSTVSARSGLLPG